MKTPAKPRLAVWKFTSCTGCQLALLDCEDELRTVAGTFDLAVFRAVSRAFVPGPYDISLVEGSITTPQEAERIHKIRRDSKCLIVIGACATAGGIQALRNWRDLKETQHLVYASPEAVVTLRKSAPISDHVPVDYELRGCPVDKTQLLELLNALLNHRRPRLFAHSVCLECKERGTVCLTVTQGVPCMGPVTYAGCGALCPAVGRGCYGCFGPKEAANVPAMTALFSKLGMNEPAIVRSLRSYNGAADAFRTESERHEKH